MIAAALRGLTQSLFAARIRPRLVVSHESSAKRSLGLRYSTWFPVQVQLEQGTVRCQAVQVSASGIVLEHTGPCALLAVRALPAHFSVRPASYGGAPVAEDSVLSFRASGRTEPSSLVLANPAGAVLVAGDPLHRVPVAAQAVAR